MQPLVKQIVKLSKELDFLVAEAEAIPSMFRVVGRLGAARFMLGRVVQDLTKPSGEGRLVPRGGLDKSLPRGDR